MTSPIPCPLRIWGVRLAPIGIFAVLAALTMLVWRQQVAHQRALLKRHTEDVCAQSARRLEVATEYSLRGASAFARRWTTHDREESPRVHFEEFADILVAEIPGYRSIHFVQPDRKEIWSVPRGVLPAWVRSGNDVQQLLDLADRSGSVLSAPVQDGAYRSVFAALPLHNEDHLIGWMVAEMDASTLIDAGFLGRGDREFAMWAEDAGLPLYASLAASASRDALENEVRASTTVNVRNRRWEFTVVPLHATYAQAGWGAAWPIPLFGLLLSVGLSLLVYQLFRRADQFKAARDRAVEEVAERQKAEAALRESEARYRSVFQSATDGFLVSGQDHRIVEANPAACAMHAYEPGALRGVSMREVITPDCVQLYDGFKADPNPVGLYRTDSRHFTRDGRVIEIEVRATKFLHGDEPRILTIVTDVTQRRRALQRLENLSREVLMAQEDERARVSRDLHDELGQLLTASRLELGFFRKRAVGLTDEAKGALSNVVELVEKSADELRRICKGLRPPLLDDLGLEPAARLLVSDFEDRTGIRIDFEVAFEDAQTVLPKEVSLCTYRILQESLNNVSRHSGATNVHITLQRVPSELRLYVRDDGSGFDTNEQGQGCGIAGMRERAGLVSGHLEIRSTRSQGTHVALRVPLAEDPSERLNHDSDVGGR